MLYLSYKSSSKIGGCHMKKLLLGSIALATVAAGPAMAADMPVKAPAPVVSYYDWTGVYIGASIGGVWGDHHRFYPAGPIFPGGDFTWSFNDTVWDVHLGAQQQW